MSEKETISAKQIASEFGKSHFWANQFIARNGLVQIAKQGNEKLYSLAEYLALAERKQRLSRHVDVALVRAFLSRPYFTNDGNNKGQIS